MDVRRANLSTWAQRVFSDKRAAEDWNVRQLAAAAGVSKDTIYSLTKGDWSNIPKAITIEKICENLGIPVDEPLEILGYHRRTTPPEPVRSEVAKSLDRVMHDPNVPTERKRMITDMVFGLIREYLPRSSTKRHSA